MCQECVKEGRMTQAELDEKLAAGDKNAIPMMELPLMDFLLAISDMVSESIGAGEISIQDGLDLSTEFMDAYADLRREAGNPITPAEMEAVPQTYAEAKGAPWN